MRLAPRLTFFFLTSQKMSGEVRYASSGWDLAFQVYSVYDNTVPEEFRDVIDPLVAKFRTICPYGSPEHQQLESTMTDSDTNWRKTIFDKI